MSSDIPDLGYDVTADSQSIFFNQQVQIFT